MTVSTMKRLGDDRHQIVDWGNGGDSRDSRQLSKSSSLELEYMSGVVLCNALHRDRSSIVVLMVFER